MTARRRSIGELSLSEQLSIEIFYDYLCPFAYSSSVWTRQLDELMGDKLAITWSAFPLEQVNSTEGPDWKLWEHPDDSLSQGLLAFQAAKAAARQGPEAFLPYHYALMDLRHVSRRTLTRKSTLLQLAKDLELDAERFARDLEDPALLAQIGEDYERGRSEYGVFGTPTLIFPGGGALYVQMNPAPPLSEAEDVLKSFARMADDRPYLIEIKRPA